MFNTLPGKKTYLFGWVGVILAVIELTGMYDFPYIDDPVSIIQVALASMFIRKGIENK